MEDMNLPALIEKFGSEEKCRGYLEELRWPNGVACPRCQSKKISRLADRRQYECSDCRYQFSVTAGTVMHDSHLPLWKWFLAIYLIAESKKGISAKQLQRMLKVSYKTAWYLCHRIREAMGDDNAPQLRGIVEVDETYIGGKARHVVHGGTGGHGGGDGSWRKRKAMVIGAVERGGQVRMRYVPGQATRGALHDFVAEHVHDDASAIYTDDSPAYGDLSDANTRHETVNHSRDEWVRGDIHTNTVESVWSLFDRAVIGSYHKLSRKHLPRYLDEFTYRFNNRENPFLFRDTVRALTQSDTLTMRQLVDGH